MAGRLVYIRTPETVTMSPALPLAFEHGAWRGESAIDGAAQASGIYTAKWRRFGSEWMIEAELYLTMT